MTPIDAWLQRQAAREQRVITLEDALLGNQAGAYARYRLRYFALRCVASALVHGVRLTLLQFIFSHQAFLTTLLLNAIAGLATSFWWGALEGLRARVRHLSRDDQRQRIPDEIGQWLTIAAGLALTSLLLTAGWVGWQSTAGRHAFDVLQFYTCAIGVRLAVDVLTLTFHSGVYAVRRVYRPLPAMVAVELLSLVAVVALWPWWGRWSFPIAVLLGTALSAALVVRYTARLYRLLGWLPLRLRWPARAWFARWRLGAECLAAGLSYALMKFDAFLMLAMFHTRVPAGGDVSLFVFFVSIGPAVQAGFDWAQLLYFDLKKLNTKCLRVFRQRFERLAVRLAWVVGLGLWGFACVLGTAITRHNLGDLYWLIGPFFLARSFLALGQIRAFAARRYRALFASGALLLAGMLVLQVALQGESYKVLAVALASALAAAMLRPGARADADELFARRVLPVTEWLARVQAVREPVRLCVLRLRAHERPRLGPRTGRALAPAQRWRLRRMALRVAGRLGSDAAVTVLVPDQVAWYEVGGRRPALDRRALLRWGGGLVESIGGTRLEGDGAAVLRAGLAARLLGGPFARVRQFTSGARDIPALRRAFAEMVPDGVIYAPDEPVPALLQSVSSWDRRRILFEGVHFATHLQGSARPGRFDVTSYCVAGELSLLFIIDRRCDRRRRLRWRVWITGQNVASVLAEAEAAGSTDTTTAAVTPGMNGRRRHAQARRPLLPPVSGSVDKGAFPVRGERSGRWAAAPAPSAAQE